MLHKNLTLHLDWRVDFALKFALSTVILVFLGQLKLDWSLAVPLTFQSLLVVLLPLIFGWAPGALSVLAYLLLGGLGAPVFAGGASGWEIFTQDSGGFLIAFLFVANLAGFFAQFTYKMETMALVLILTLGQSLILLAGLFWMEGVRQEDFDYGVQLEVFLPALLMKSVMGMVVYIILKRAIERRSAQPQI